MDLATTGVVGSDNPQSMGKPSDLKDLYPTENEDTVTTSVGGSGSFDTLTLCQRVNVASDKVVGQ